MEAVGDVERYKRNYNTCQLAGRVFSALEHDWKLVLSETLLGDRVWEAEVATGVELDARGNVSLCAFSGRLFALIVKGGCAKSAMLIRPGPQPLGQAGPTEVTSLYIQGQSLEMNDFNQIVQVAPTKVLVSAKGSSNLFLLTVSEGGKTATVEPLALKLPGGITSYCTLVRVDSGRIFAFGGYNAPGYTNRVTLVDVTGNACSEMAPLPVPGRKGIGCAGLGRFVFAFGGSDGGDKDDLVLYDTETQASCAVPKAGDWHAANDYCALAISADYLYVFGGWDSNPCTRISLPYVQATIADPALKSAFGEFLTMRINELARYAAEQKSKEDQERAYAEELWRQQEAARAAEDARARIAVLYGENEELRRALAVSGGTIGTLTKCSEEKDHVIASLRRMLAERDAEIARLNEKLARHMRGMQPPVPGY